MAPILPQVPGAAPAEFTAGLTDAQHYVLWQEWDVYLRRVGTYNDATLRTTAAAASQAIADAQAATAVQMGRAADAQAATIAAFNQPAPVRAQTDDELTVRFTEILAGAGVGTSAATVAQAYVRALRLALKPVFQVPL